MQHEEHDVLQLIAEGRLTELSLEVLSDEISGLYEDLLNFEVGHMCDVAPITEGSSTLKMRLNGNFARLDGNLTSARALIAQSRILVAQCKMQTKAGLH